MNSILNWAIELQSLAQSGLFYSEDKYDRERFERIREIAAEMVSEQSNVSIEKVKNLFCNETGYQTPKLDTRGVILKDNKILLVQEDTGFWALPGGWVDVGVSVKENVEKEVHEEAGLTVKAERIIAVHDVKKHNRQYSLFSVCKIFIQCVYISGQFEKNLETIDSGYFALDQLPKLAVEKNTKKQIAMCFKAYNMPFWIPELD